MAERRLFIGIRSRAPPHLSPAPAQGFAVRLFLGGKRRHGARISTRAGRGPDQPWSASTQPARARKDILLKIQRKALMVGFVCRSLLGIHFHLMASQRARPNHEVGWRRQSMASGEPCDIALHNKIQNREVRP
ncbi:MAG TPA: hypothetical protein DCE18_20495 [Syntrophobacteraceae bacterium]|nr:hypothetical protein [Syntrophobacteraceae bacterium]